MRSTRTTIWAAAAAFTAYFSMYGFRKPFAVAQFEDLYFAGTAIELKTAIVISQIIGYALSKYLGIRYCSELTRRKAAWTLVLLIGLAFLSLALFAIAPPPLKVLAIFFNGLPLGMVWGMIVRFLEGRRTSDFMLSALCFSFLIASGIVKDVGRWLMSAHAISESWMPFATGCVFLGPYLLAVWGLVMLPPPDATDIRLRVERRPMSREDRFRFLRQFATGLIPLMIAYCLLTAFRDYRDNYGIEILVELGYDQSAAVFTKMELPVGIVLLLLLGMLFLVKDNLTCLRLIFAMMIAGALTLALSNLLYVSGHISGFTWMVLIGFGAYLIYVPYNALLFERMIAATGTIATAVFAIYVADAFGYTTSVAIQLYKDLLAGDASRLSFFISYTWLLSATALVCLTLSLRYFNRVCAPAADRDHMLHKVAESQ